MADVSKHCAPGGAQARRSALQFEGEQIRRLSAVWGLDVRDRIAALGPLVSDWQAAGPR